MNIIIIFILSFLQITTFAQSEEDLAKVINEYRKQKGLKEIPISPALTKVAELHVKDLVENSPTEGKCNMHSWSNNGDWKGCCYTSNHANPECMWNKPRELTDYKGNGYEIAAWYSSGITATEALKIWQGSKGHHQVIINNGIWKNTEWKAMGAAIYKGYAVVWFGELEDHNSE